MNLNSATRAPGHRQSGQAMVEMVVALVAIVVITAGLLHIARLAMAHTEAMHEARRQAGERAMQHVPTWASPGFIHDWHPGFDGSRYSQDDYPIAAAPSTFAMAIPAVARPDALNAHLPGNPVSVIAALSLPQHEFHMVRGDGVRHVDAPPAIRNLIYDADLIELRGEVWMIYTRGMF